MRRLRILASSLLLPAVQAVILVAGVIGNVRAAEGPQSGATRDSIRCITAEVNGNSYHLLLDAAIPAGHRIARNAAFIRLAHSLEIENVNRSTPEEAQRHRHATTILQAATLDQLVCDDPVSTCLASGGFRRILILGCASGCDGPGCQVCRFRTQE